MKIDFEYKGEKFCYDDLGYLKHIESKTTFKNESKAKKWVNRIEEDYKAEGGL